MAGFKVLGGHHLAMVLVLPRSTVFLLYMAVTSSFISFSYIFAVGILEAVIYSNVFSALHLTPGLIAFWHSTTLKGTLSDSEAMKRYRSSSSTIPLLNPNISLSIDICV